MQYVLMNPVLCRNCQKRTEYGEAIMNPMKTFCLFFAGIVPFPKSKKYSRLAPWICTLHVRVLVSPTLIYLVVSRFCTRLGFLVISYFYLSVTCTTFLNRNSTLKCRGRSKIANDPVIEGSNVTVHYFAMLDSDLEIASDEDGFVIATNHDSFENKASYMRCGSSIRSP